MNLLVLEMGARYDDKFVCVTGLAAGIACLWLTKAYGFSSECTLICLFISFYQVCYRLLYCFSRFANIILRELLVFLCFIEWTALHLVLLKELDIILELKQQLGILGHYPLHLERSLYNVLCVVA